MSMQQLAGIPRNKRPEPPAGECDAADDAGLGRRHYEPHAAGADNVTHRAFDLADPTAAT